MLNKIKGGITIKESEEKNLDSPRGDITPDFKEFAKDFWQYIKSRIIIYIIIFIVIATGMELLYIYAGK